LKEAAALLARLPVLSYLGPLLLAAGCVRPAAVAPTAGFETSSLDAITAESQANGPSGYEVLRFRWHFNDGQLQVSGSGAARVAAPDSLRADIGATLGLGRATVILAGDSVAAQPANAVERLFVDRFALWAALGYLRIPPAVRRVERGTFEAQVVWRLTHENGLVTLFTVQDGRLARVSREQAGRTVQQLVLTRDPASGRVARAKLTDLARGVELAIDITAREPSAAFPPAIWRLRP
jgi:hypothetical protein